MGRRKKEYNLTADHFRMFVAEFKRTADMLGMTDWRLEFKFEDMTKYAGDRDTIIHGMCDTDPESRSATIILGKEIFTANDVNDEVRDTARHECIELLLSDMVCAAYEREWNERSFNSLKHSVISKLCNMLEKIEKTSER